MKLTGKNLLMILVTTLGAIFLSIELSRFSDISYSRTAMYLVWIFYIPLNHHGTKKKIANLKRKCNLEGDYTLEEIEVIRIEMDYQEHFVKKLNLK